MKVLIAMSANRANSGAGTEEWPVVGIVYELREISANGNG